MLGAGVAEERVATKKQRGGQENAWANNHKLCDYAGTGRMRCCGAGRAMDMEGFIKEQTHELRLCLKAVYWAKEGEQHPRQWESKTARQVCLKHGGLGRWAMVEDEAEKVFWGQAVVRNLEFCLVVLSPRKDV